MGFCDLIFIDHCFWSAMWTMKGLYIYIYITKSMDYSNANVATRLAAPGGEELLRGS